MKLSFSTRGWPGLTWDEMLETATDMGFSGVEVYNLPDFEILTDRGGPFHKYNTAATVRKLRDNGITIPCFDTSCDISENTDATEKLKLLIEIAHNTHVPYVVACALYDNEDKVFQELATLLPLAEKFGVTVLVLVNDRGNWSSRKVCKGVSDWQQMPGCEIKVIRNKTSWEVQAAVPMNIILPNAGELRFNMVRDRHVTGKPAEYSTGSPLAMSGIWMDPKNLGTVQFEK